MFARVSRRERHAELRRRVAELDVLFSQHASAVRDLLERLKRTCGMGESANVDPRPLARAMLRAALRVGDPTHASANAMEHLWCGTYLAAAPDPVPRWDRPRFAVQDGDLRLCVPYACTDDLSRLHVRGCRVTADPDAPATAQSSALRRRENVRHRLEFDLDGGEPTVTERDGTELRMHATVTAEGVEESLAGLFMRVPVSVRLASTQTRVLFDNRVAFPDVVFRDANLAIDRRTRFERTRVPRNFGALRVLGAAHAAVGSEAGRLAEPGETDAIRPAELDSVLRTVASVDPRVTLGMAKRALGAVPMHPFVEAALVTPDDVDEDREGARTVYLLARVVLLAERIDFGPLRFDALLAEAFALPRVAVSIIRDSAGVFPVRSVVDRLRVIAQMEAQLEGLKASMREPNHDPELDDLIDGASADVARFARSLRVHSREVIADGSKLAEVEAAVRDRAERLERTRAELRNALTRVDRAHRRAARQDRSALHRIERRLVAVRRATDGDVDRACLQEAPRLVDDVARTLQQVADEPTRRAVAIEYIKQACDALDHLRLPAPECFERSSATTAQAASKVLSLLQ